MLEQILNAYNWQASLATLVLTIACIALGRAIIYRLPAVVETRAKNREANIKKLKNKRDYAERVKKSKMVALMPNLFLFLFVLPFITSFDAQPVWRVLLDIFAILMIYDFFYYLMHRFLFHGKGFMRQVHAIHHQARNPTSLDSLLLHSLEAFLGVALFVVVICGYALALSSTFHVVTISASIVIYTQINQLNHVHIDLHRFPYNTVNWISDKHAIHHINMHHGNYATITLFFDKLFGTYE